ncbi:hypothetical protein BMW23_1109 [Bodo saltans virus]|jgi:hypothetical protein|uniref:Uncharacterized protein n=1 Tax=Bodo saltans virus TaxID=2024608 RepID=A0A2H4UW28_9VIRU|nr:hypothetical protein QJ851_gp1089 [Bodo saltans virus]ATZ81152.1 hypothetical protein BMW23_1109 [Bodo saltans virus]
MSAKNTVGNSNKQILAIGTGNNSTNCFDLKTMIGDKYLFCKNIRNMPIFDSDEIFESCLKLDFNKLPKINAKFDVDINIDVMSEI